MIIRLFQFVSKSIQNAVLSYYLKIFYFDKSKSKLYEKNIYSEHHFLQVKHSNCGSKVTKKINH